MFDRFKYIILAAILWATSFAMPVIGQTNAMGSRGFGIIHQEGVYLHQSSALLFAGERLYYKVYCLDLEEKKLSKLSKIAYVRLLSEQGEVAFSHKIRLTQGTGKGDFSIPSELPTGSYKLQAYTSWMLSRSEKQYFESDLLIINPYKATTESFLEPKVIDSLKPDSTVARPVVAKFEKPEFKPKGDQIVSLKLDDTSYDTRSAVTVMLEPLKYSASGGNYSLTVRKADKSLPAASETSIEIWDDYGKSWTRKKGNFEIIPELRGELFSGQVLRKDDGKPAEGIKVILSLPGDPFVLEIARTNPEGRFYFNLDTPVSSAQAVFQIFDKDRALYDLLFDSLPVPDYEPADFEKFTISSDLEAAILERSIHNQIENAYAIIKSDTIVNVVEDIPFYRQYQQQFFLDDYTRFNTLRETMVEIVDNVWIDENGDADPTFGVRPFDGYLDAGGLFPMVFIDGLFIQNHNNIINYNSKEIRSVSLSRDRYMVGSLIFQGLLSLETKSGEFYESLYREHLLRRAIERPEPERHYYFTDYHKEQDASRIPDFRYQLFWSPKIVLGEGSSQIRFSTSDVKGEFELELKGFSAEGEPIFQKMNFTVE